ncbi:MAG TPA: shikimate kinase [Patescibacteria group bacterium]|nr:shikimate kinase [Patescibacteria group bacterium]
MTSEGVGPTNGAAFSADEQRRASGLVLPDGASKNLLVPQTPDRLVLTPAEKEKFGHVILLIWGPPGGGKSTTAPILAEKTGMDIIELDDEVEKDAGRTIKELWDDRGERYFRQWESSSFLKAMRPENKGKIISCGGGVLVEDRNLALVVDTEYAIPAYLFAPEHVLLDRVLKDKDHSRPGLSDVEYEKAKATMSERVRTRGPRYGIANIAVDTSRRTPEQAADYIIKQGLKIIDKKGLAPRSPKTQSASI